MYCERRGTPCQFSSLARRHGTYVMVPAEKNEQSGRSRRNETKTCLGKGVWVEQPTAGSLVTNGILLSLVRPVQDGEVEVGRRVVFGHVPGVCAEKHMRNQRRICKRQRRIASWVVLEL